jgi:hypothetical protein
MSGTGYVIDERLDSRPNEAYDKDRQAFCLTWSSKKRRRRTELAAFY